MEQTINHKLDAVLSALGNLQQQVDRLTELWRSAPNNCGGGGESFTVGWATPMPEQGLPTENLAEVE